MNSKFTKSAMSFFAKKIYVTIPVIIAFAILYNPQTFPFWGDDYLLWRYHTFQGGMASSWETSAFQVAQEKYRPAYQFVVSILLKFFGNDPELFMLVNAALLVISGIVLGQIISLRFQNLKISIFFGLLLVSTSRFTWYSTSNALGILETLSTLWILLYIKHYVIAIQTNMRRSFCQAGAYFALAIFTHERYMLIGVSASFLIFILTNIHQNKFSKLAHLPLFLVLVNFAIKEFIFEVNILQGSGIDIADASKSDILKTLILNLPKSFKVMLGNSEYISNRYLSLFLAITSLGALSLLLVKFKRIKYGFSSTGSVNTGYLLFLILTLFGALLPGLIEGNLQERFLLVPYLCGTVVLLALLSRLINFKIALYAISIFALVIYAFYFPLRSTSNYYESSARKVYAELAVHLNQTPDEPWYLIVTNYGVSLWMLGYIRDYDPGSFSQFKNPPIVFWDGPNLPIEPGKKCLILIVDPLYLPQIQDCPQRFS